MSWVVVVVALEFHSRTSFCDYSAAVVVVIIIITIIMNGC
jgi:hypothetical protein